MDPAFTRQSLRDVVRKIDFLVHPELRGDSVLEAEVSSALDLLNQPKRLLAEISYEKKAGKPLARAKTFRAKLALRKVSENLGFAFGMKPDNRELVTNALRTVLSEAVGYRVYKLDVRRFFESFESESVVRHLKDRRVAATTSTVVEQILTNHAAQSYSGLPRGLSMSSTLAEVMMEWFDSRVLQHPDVFFYRRYVDDLTIVTSAREDSRAFISMLEDFLPSGLRFKKAKQYELVVKSIRKPKPTNTTVFQSFDYLGYEFNVAVDGHKPNDLFARDVWLDVARVKVARIKSRLLSCFFDYLYNNDFALLEKRIRHLTSNLSMLDRGKGIRRLAGIHYNYPQVDTSRSRNLHELDRFLANALASTKGRVYSRLAKELSPAQKTALAKYSFFRGARDKKFFQMSLKELGRVQECWKYGN